MCRRFRVRLKTQGWRFFRNAAGLKDNDDLGGVLLSVRARPSVEGVYTVAATDNRNPPASHFQMVVTVEFIPDDTEHEGKDRDHDHEKD